MTKREFLESLRLALNGRVTSGQLTENLDYYEDYINTEIRKGRQETEVLEQLGDPRLIARTIVQTGGGSRRAAQYGESEAWYGESAGDGYQSDGQYEGGRPARRFGRIPPWVWLILALLVVVLILSVIFSVISALLPILLPILVVLFLVKVFRDWLN